MFEHHSHSYFIQALALWVSFVPEAGILLLIIGAQVERLKRARRWRERAVRLYRRASVGTRARTS